MASVWVGCPVKLEDLSSQRKVLTDQLSVTFLLLLSVFRVTSGCPQDE